METKLKLAFTKQTITIILVVIVVAAIGTSYYLFITPTPTGPLNLVVSEQGPSTPSILVTAAADKMGIFKKNGLNVTSILSPDPPTALRVLASGQAQVADISYPTFLAAAVQGQPFKVFYVPSVVQNFFFATRSDIQSLADLKGKIIATAGPATADHVLWTLALRSVGLDIDKDVQTVRIGISPEKFNALSAGRAAAAALVTEFIPRVRGNPQLRILDMNPNSKYEPFFPFHVLVTTSSVVEKNPRALELFTKSVMETLRSFQDDPKFFADAMNRAFPDQFKPDDITQLWETFRAMGYWGVNGGINVANLNKSLDLYFAQINPSASRTITKATDFLVTSFVNQALNEFKVQQVPWDTPDWRTG